MFLLFFSFLKNLTFWDGTFFVPLLGDLLTNGHQKSRQVCRLDFTAGVLTESLLSRQNKLDPLLCIHLSGGIWICCLYLSTGLWCSAPRSQQTSGGTGRLAQRYEAYADLEMFRSSLSPCNLY